MPTLSGIARPSAALRGMVGLGPGSNEEPAAGPTIQLPTEAIAAIEAVCGIERMLRLGIAEQLPDGVPYLDVRLLALFVFKTMKENQNG